MAFEIVIPRLGWSMEEGTFSGWLKQDGDTVRPGDALFSLEGEKAIQEIEALDAGVLRIPPDGPDVGTIVKVGAVVGYLVGADEALPQSTAPIEVKSSATPALAPIASPSVRRRAKELGVDLQSVVGSGRSGRITTEDLQPKPLNVAAVPPVMHAESARAAVASPRARRVAKELGVDWRQLRGTGSNGRIRERDVRESGSRNVSSGVRQSITNRRKVIAERLTASRQQTVPVTLTAKADATNLVNLREQFKAVEGTAAIPSYQDIIVKLTASLLAQHKMLASRWDNNAIIVPEDNEMHIGVAVDTADGLLVPVIRDVNGSTLAALAENSRDLIERARNGSLSLNEMQGGVFTITNLGAFGIDSFTPVINLPESAILGLGSIRLEPVVATDGTIVARYQIYLSLTFDHRVVDGAPAARFLQSLVSALANPSAVLLRER